MAAWAVYIPAQPQAECLAFVEWGALSVPRKNLLVPEVAARRRAWRWVSLFNMGRQ